MKGARIRSFLLMSFLCGVSEAFSELEEEKEYSLLKKLTATCGKDGIKVSVRFNEPFSGIVYSDGYYDKPQCVFINQENYTASAVSVSAVADNRFSFLIPADECGTVFHDPGSSLSSQLDDNSTKADKNELANEVFMENTVMFQKNHFIQEQGDVLQKLRCVWQKEIRKPLHATLPLRGKHKHKTENVKVVRPSTTLNYKKAHLRHSTSHHHNHDRGNKNNDHEVSTSTTDQPVRYSSISRKRFQPVGQVESVSPFSTRRRDGKSLDYQNEPRVIYKDADTNIISSSTLNNLTALPLPFKQDDVSKATSLATTTFHQGFTWIIINLLCNLIVLNGATNLLI